LLVSIRHRSEPALSLSNGTGLVVSRWCLVYCMSYAVYRWGSPGDAPVSSVSRPIREDAWRCWRQSRHPANLHSVFCILNSAFFRPSSVHGLSGRPQRARAGVRVVCVRILGLGGC